MQCMCSTGALFTIFAQRVLFDVAQFCNVPLFEFLHILLPSLEFLVAEQAILEVKPFFENVFCFATLKV